MSDSEDEPTVEAAAVDDTTSQKVHPLLQPLVLANLFKFLRSGDLAQARAVCRIWNEIATPQLESKIHEFTIDFTKFTNLENRRKMELFLDMAKGTKLEFSNFRFGRECKLHKLRVFEKLMNNVQANITQLRLCYAERRSALTQSDFRDLLLRKAPFLETLDLQGLPAHIKSNSIFKPNTSPTLELTNLKLSLEHRTPSFSDEFLVDIFKASPYLESLKISSDWFHDSEYKERRILRQAIRYGRPEILTKLELKHVGYRLMAILVPGLSSSSIQEFKVGTLYNDNNVQALLQSFLNSHKNTLEDLELGFRENDPADVPLIFPRMMKLKKLMMNLAKQVIGVLDYGQLFPSLETLKYGARFNVESETRLIDQYIFPMSSTPCPTLKDLELPTNLDRPEVLRNIARIFPNVVKLNVAGQKCDVLAALWECWPDVERLAISVMCDRSLEDKRMRPRTLDSIFTGFSESTCVKLKKKIRKGKILDFKQFNAKREMPSIGSLKNLKYLIVHGGPDLISMSGSLYGIKRLSDLTFLTSFMELRHILFIFVDGAATKYISEHCTHTLSTTLDLFEVEDSFGFHLVKYEWQCIEGLADAQWRKV